MIFGPNYMKTMVFQSHEQLRYRDLTELQLLGKKVLIDGELLFNYVPFREGAFEYTPGDQHGRVLKETSQKRQAIAPELDRAKRKKKDGIDTQEEAELPLNSDGVAVDELSRGGEVE